MAYEDFREQELNGWDQRASNYETLTARVTTQAIPALLGAAKIRVGLNILDICTGPGFAAGAADAIGAKAEGVDFAPSMIETASKRFTRPRFWEGDAVSLSVEDNSFDAAICNFGVFHFTDPTDAFSEAFRVIRPSGYYAFSQWAAPKDSPLFKCVFPAILKHADMSKVPPSPDPFAYSDKDLCRKSLVDVGFTNIDISNVPSVYHANSDEFWNEFLQFSVRTPIILQHQTKDIIASIEKDVTSAVAEFVNDGKVAIPMPSFVVSGVKPD